MLGDDIKLFTATPEEETVASSQQEVIGTNRGKGYGQEREWEGGEGILFC
jgi:hypothetical protein